MWPHEEACFDREHGASPGGEHAELVDHSSSTAVVGKKDPFEIQPYIPVHSTCSLDRGGTRERAPTVPSCRAGRRQLRPGWDTQQATSRSRAFYRSFDDVILVAVLKKESKLGIFFV